MRIIKPSIPILLVIAVVVIPFLVSSCGQTPVNGQNATQQEPDDGAAQLSSMLCASCHGEDLAGGNAQSLIDGVWQFGDGAGYVRRNIQFGITHLGMPSYDETLSGDEIKSLVDYLYDMQSKVGAVKPDLPAELERA